MIALPAPVLGTGVRIPGVSSLATAFPLTVMVLPVFSSDASVFDWQARRTVSGDFVL